MCVGTDPAVGGEGEGASAGATDPTGAARSTAGGSVAAVASKAAAAAPGPGSGSGSATGSVHRGVLSAIVRKSKLHLLQSRSTTSRRSSAQLGQNVTTRSSASMPWQRAQTYLGSSRLSLNT